MRQTKIGLILAVTSLLAACGESSAPETPAGSAAGKTEPVEAAKKDPLGEKRALIQQLEPLPLAENSLYKDAMQPLVLVDLYHSFKPAPEADEDVSLSMGSDINYGGFPADLIKLVAAHTRTSDAFARRDAAKALAEAIQSRKVAPDDRRLRVELTRRDFVLGSYDFDRKGFVLQSSLLRPEASEMPSSWAPFNTNPYAPKARTYVSIPPVSYRIGFDHTEALGFLKVEDEATARVIEAERDNMTLALYGSVVRVFRDYNFNTTPPTPDNERYVIVQPQRVELVDAAGKVVFTFDL